MELDTYLQEIEEDLTRGEKIIWIKVSTNAPKNEFTSILDADHPILKIKIKAIPEKGKANKIIIKFCQNFFCANVEILSGQTNSLKRLKIFRV